MSLEPINPDHALELYLADPYNSVTQARCTPTVQDWVGTPLKNGETGIRFIALSEDVCEVLDDWIGQ